MSLHSFYSDLQTRLGPSPGRDPSCAICQEDLEADTAAVVHTTCNNAFDIDCLDEFLMHEEEADAMSDGERPPRCPTCRGNLQPISVNTLPINHPRLTEARSRPTVNELDDVALDEFERLRFVESDDEIGIVIEVAVEVAQYAEHLAEYAERMFGESDAFWQYLEELQSFDGLLLVGRAPNSFSDHDMDLYVPPEYSSPNAAHSRNLALLRDQRFGLRRWMSESHNQTRLYYQVRCQHHELFHNSIYGGLQSWSIPADLLLEDPLLFVEKLNDYINDPERDVRERLLNMALIREMIDFGISSMGLHLPIYFDGGLVEDLELSSRR